MRGGRFRRLARLVRSVLVSAAAVTVRADGRVRANDNSWTADHVRGRKRPARRGGARPSGETRLIERHVPDGGVRRSRTGLARSPPADASHPRPGGALSAAAYD